ncbi:Diphthamide biosynthesis protein 7 [Strongyloides ratti]|uniref:methylated diphthine methylhydrolase n=1 Tax=Strongyloides ratti TaxID=34506 RepID=A0A090MYH4_STRRB|nr:Diphthamide biosynthesis protein 7 [Strongyloides ratti]CEF67189.1 Diphthamide biosynthesis protein 7 [Strongyloides ratti]
MVQIREISSFKLHQRPAYCKYLESISSVIVSTYQLENSQDRSGSFIFFNNQLEKIKEIKTEAGIFRFSVDKFKSNYILASLTNGKLGSINVKNNDIIYSNKLSDDNLGTVFIIDGDKEYNIIENKVVHLLPFVKSPCEVWSCGFIKLNDGNIFGTGGDDGSLKIWDKRQGLNECIDKFVTTDNSGITFISHSIYHENEYIVCSYDENFRIFDIRNMKEPKNLLKLNGGIWYVEEHIKNNIQQFYTSCMYGGWSLIENKDNILSLKIKNDNHGKDLLYGVTKIDDFNVVNCTFNDFTVRLETLQ